MRIQATVDRSTDTIVITDDKLPQQMAPEHREKEASQVIKVIWLLFGRLSALVGWKVFPFSIRENGSPEVVRAAKEGKALPKCEPPPATFGFTFLAFTCPKYGITLPAPADEIVTNLDGSIKERKSALPHKLDIKDGQECCLSCAST